MEVQPYAVKQRETKATRKREEGRKKKKIKKREKETVGIKKIIFSLTLLLQ